MRDGFISMGHGRSLVNVENRPDQLRIYEKILEGNLSVRETEALVRSYHEKGEPKPTSSRKAPALPDFAEEGLEALRDYLHSGVSIQATGNGKGKITIPFHNREEFRRLKKKITGA
jgi:ParB family chromosome partitioning protein